MSSFLLKHASIAFLHAWNMGLLGECYDFLMMKVLVLARQKTTELPGVMTTLRMPK